MLSCRPKVDPDPYLAPPSRLYQVGPQTRRPKTAATVCRTSITCIGVRLPTAPPSGANKADRRSTRPCTIVASRMIRNCGLNISHSARIDHFTTHTRLRITDIRLGGLPSLHVYQRITDLCNNMKPWVSGATMSDLSQATGLVLQLTS